MKIRNQANALSRAETIEQNALEVRSKLGLANAIAPNMGEFLRLTQSKAKGFQVEITTKEKLGQTEAVMNNDTGILTVSESILVLASNGDTHSRFTIAHEAAHFFIGHPGANARKGSAGTYSSVNQRRFENEANLWARHFLVPFSLSKDCKTPYQIASKFCVSLEMATIAHEENQRRIRQIERKPREPISAVVEYLADYKKRR